jgi:hypothetical protein
MRLDSVSDGRHDVEALVPRAAPDAFSTEDPRITELYLFKRGFSPNEVHEIVRK